MTPPLRARSQGSLPPSAADPSLERLPVPAMGARSGGVTVQQLRIGGVTVRLQWEGHHSAPSAHPLYEPFTAEGPADLTLHVAAAPMTPPPATTILDGWPHWRLQQTTDGQLLYEVLDPRAPHPRLHWALVNRELTDGAIVIEDGRAPLGRVMEPLGQLLFLQQWAQRQAYMVHALAVDDRGMGRVFVGHSGAGKSTLARWYQADGVTVLSDERVVLQLDGDRLLAYGTPWPGMAWTGAPGPVEVDTLYFLQHARQHALEPLAPSTAIALLYPQLFLLSRDRAEEVDAALAWCEQLLVRVPVARLAFAKAPDVLHYVRSTTSQNVTCVIR